MQVKIFSAIKGNLVDMGTEWGGKGSRGDFHVNVNVPNRLGFGHWKAINICQHSITELSYVTLV